MSCLNTIRHDLCIVQGDDATFSMAYKDSTGTAIDLTGYTMTLSFNNATYDRTATIDDAVGGLFSFRYESEDTAAFDLANVQGVVVKSLAGEVTSLYRVTLKVEGR